MRLLSEPSRSGGAVGLGVGFGSVGFIVGFAGWLVRRVVGWLLDGSPGWIIVPVEFTTYLTLYMVDAHCCVPDEDD